LGTTQKVFFRYGYKFFVSDRQPRKNSFLNELNKESAMPSSFPPPINRLVLGAWSAGVYPSDDNHIVEPVQDMPYEEKSTAGCRDGLFKHKAANTPNIEESNVKLQTKYTAPSYP
jgi:hypothetical protein